MARGPQPRESEREEGATISTIARRHRRRQRDNGIEELVVIREREPVRRCQRWDRLRRDVLTLPTNHVRRQLGLVDGPRDGAEEEREERSKIVRAVVHGG